MNGGMIPVLSSNIDGIWHDFRSSSLLVTFNSKKTYCYKDVPKTKFDEFLISPSKGQFLNAEIKPCFSSTELSASEVEAMIKGGAPLNLNRRNPRQRLSEMAFTHPILSALF